MPFTIGQAADRSGCSTPTIRYYEEIGLLPEIGRTPKGRRAYSWPQIHRLKFIRRARDLGLSIDQVRMLLGISDGDQTTCGDAGDLLRVHIETLRRRRAELEGFERTLEQLAQRCASTCATDPGASCVIFDDDPTAAGAGLLGARSET